MTGVNDERRAHVYQQLLRRTQQARGDQIADCLAEVLQPSGVRATCYLVDEEQRRLHALPQARSVTPGMVAVDGTLAGRAFSTVTAVSEADGAGWWLPLVDGTERLGVVRLSGRLGAQDIEGWCEDLVNLVGHLVAVKMRYGDRLHRIRRTRPMSVESELLQAMLPPLTFTCQGLVISCILEPVYEIGGDAFDYAVDGDEAYVSILDAIGHGPAASLMAAAALAALRAARREDHGLYRMAQAVDEVFQQQFTASAFVTAILGQLNTRTGRLRYINAGHPRPLVLRHHRAVRELDGGRRLPLGLDDFEIHVGEEMLEPDDRVLFYSDGVVEARDQQGEMFGTERLVDLTERAGLAHLPAPEMLRTVGHKVVEFSGGRLRDDATIMMVEWSQAAVRRSLPS